jgi:hypothetical protein
MEFELNNHVSNELTQDEFKTKTEIVNKPALSEKTAVSNKQVDNETLRNELSKQTYIFSELLKTMNFISKFNQRKWIIHSVLTSVVSISIGFSVCWVWLEKFKYSRSQVELSDKKFTTIRLSKIKNINAFERNNVKFIELEHE